MHPCVLHYLAMHWASASCTFHQGIIIVVLLWKSIIYCEIDFYCDTNSKLNTNYKSIIPSYITSFKPKMRHSTNRKFESPNINYSYILPQILIEFWLSSQPATYVDYLLISPIKSQCQTIITLYNIWTASFTFPAPTLRGNVQSFCYRDQISNIGTLHLHRFSNLPEMKLWEIALNSSKIMMYLRKIGEK